MRRSIIIALTITVGLFLALSVSALPPGLGGGGITPSPWSSPLPVVWPFTSDGYLGGSVKTKGGISVNALGTPSGCAVASTVGSGATTWSYRVSALSATGETLACSAVSVTSKANTLSSTAYNTVTWTAVSGARGYYVYRTAAGTTPSSTGRLGTGACTPTVFTATTATDNGLCGDSGTVKTTASDSDITGVTGITMAAQTANTVFAGPATGAAAAPTFRAVVDADVPDTITASNYLPLAGGTMVGNLLFTDNTLDIGASGATRPRTVYVGTDVNVGGDVNITDDLTCNQATMTVNALTALTAPSVTTAVASDGILLRNTTAAATAQEFSPSLRLDGTGYTAGPTNTRQSWAITNKPGSATLGYLSFDYSVGGGAYVNKLTIDASSGRLIVPNDLNITASGWTFPYTNTWGGIAGNWFLQNASATSAIGFQNYSIASAASVIAFASDHHNAFTHEGARHWVFSSAHVPFASIDKNGVYQQGYVSTTTTNAGTSTVTMVGVPSITDDSFYRVRFVCEGIQVNATPGFYAGYTITQYVSRIDGTIAERGETVNDSYESAAGCDCTVGVTDGAGETDLITATATGCDAGAGTMQWKIWIESMQKVNGTAFTPVAQPAAN